MARKLKDRNETIADKLKFGYAMSSAARRTSSLSSADTILMKNAISKN